MDKIKEVEELAQLLKEIDSSDNQEHGPWGYKEKAQSLLNEGYSRTPKELLPISEASFRDWLKSHHCPDYYIDHLAPEFISKFGHPKRRIKKISYGTLEKDIANHLEQGTHIPIEDIEPAVRMIMISVIQEVKCEQENKKPSVDGDVLLRKIDDFYPEGKLDDYNVHLLNSIISSQDEWMSFKEEGKK